jgi:hypothetical protein
MASSNNMDLLSDWISDINKESATVEAKKRTPAARSEAAFCARTVSATDAHADLMENPEDPFLFRKWLRLRIEEGPADIREYPGPRRQEMIEEYCGLQLVKLLGCTCGGHGLYRVDPELEWQYASGQFNIKARMGGCMCGKSETRTHAGFTPGNGHSIYGVN